MAQNARSNVCKKSGNQIPNVLEAGSSAPAKNCAIKAIFSYARVSEALVFIGWQLSFRPQHPTCFVRGLLWSNHIHFATCVSCSNKSNLNWFSVYGGAAGEHSAYGTDAALRRCLEVSSTRSAS